MAYNSILTVLTDADLADATLTQAKALASAHDAHLDVLCLGVDRTQTGYYYAGANAMVLQETLQRAGNEASELAERARKQLTGTALRWAVEEGVAQLADIARHVASRARFSDLVCLPMPYGKDHGVELEPVTEGALFDGHVPVMIWPDGYPAMTPPKRIALAWNESPEAMRAARAALPLLCAAEVVHIVVIDPPRHGPTRSDPGGMMAQFLARHGVHADIDVLSKTMPRVSDVLVRHVSDMSADLVVMGAYGHSRFREAILGGATRNMLEVSPVPVFMTH
ncbi:universal stress protein [Aestuariicoccus sp. MJ-SS9]|uniref:universal stress protein n=1 Tax=Aestuariicoccus sp. MJ-SS9 TaxID=3079855 RepID=UPI002913A9A5|nr:universal stress protein [Aestuariicoccus sp. MJ-SS9]MDU8911832.1 universal stress protein [Aestuariicoccus sp. MJ-SS9]